MRTASSSNGVRARSLPAAVILTLALALSVLVSCSGTVAVAAGEGHPFLFSFGSFTNPNGIAVEESTGDVYVADIGTNTVSRFDANGKPVEFSALHSNVLSGSATPAGSFSFPSVYGTPAAIAVDNSASPSDPSRGNLYVMDAGHNVIDKFSSSGAYLSQITRPSEGELLGFALAATGDVRVAVQAPAEDVLSEVVALFDSSPKNNFIAALEGKKGAYIDHAGEEQLPMHSFALSPTGDPYMLFKCECVEKFGGALDALGRVDSVEGRPGDVAMAVDPVTGHLYVDEQSSVMEWDTGGMDGYEPIPHTNPVESFATATPVSDFGSLQLSGIPVQQGGVAVNGASGEVYVSKQGANPGEGKVYVFASAPPGVATDTVVNMHQTDATLQGRVDPRGISVTSCEFEYEKASAPKLTREGFEFTTPVPVTGFNHRVPCAQTAEQIGSGVSSVGVSAGISGLEPGVLYYFRLIAGNTNGTSPSEGMFATADSGFGVKAFSISFLKQDGTPDTQAGSHPQEMVTSFTFKTKATRRVATADSPYVLLPVGNPKDIIVVPPPGLVGNPDATEAKCTLSELEIAVGEPGEEGAKCPHGSEVGSLHLETSSYGTGSYKLYNMVPPHGLAAQFGAHVIFPKTFVNVGLHTGGQYQVQAESVDIPAIEPLFRIKATLFGVVGSGGQSKPFLTLPTGCTGPPRSTISVDSYQEPGHYVGMSEVTRNASGEPVSLTGCSQLTFPASITVAPDVTSASSSSGLAVGVHVPQTAAFNPNGLAESTLRDTTVTLPAGVTINPAGADGLAACSEGLAGFTGFTEFNPEFEPGVKWATFTPTPIGSLQPGVNFCPDGSKVGTVKIRTPLLPNALEGAVYVAAQNENPFGSLIAMYMMIEDPVSGSTVKLVGEVRLCEGAGQVVNGVFCQAPGQIVTTFKNTPDLPFEDLELHFFGGERAPLSTPARCGTYTTQASFTPWDGNAPVETSSSFHVTSGPNGGPCPGASLPFSPSLAAGTTDNQAGGFSPFTFTMSREDGNQPLQAASVKMPPGLSGLLTGVELCPEAQANAGTCGTGSLIGETTVSVGVGNDPFSVKGGRVYLTGPYKGAPFGLSVVNPAKAGPFDVEHDTSNPNYDPPCDCIVVRSKIEVDPHTAALTVTSDNEGPYKIPTILDGIPLQIKHVNVTISRPRFTFNPTNCGRLQMGGSLYSTEGAVAPVSVPFQATNCAVLGFAPKFQVSTSGRTSKARGASLHVKLAYPNAPFGSQANIAKVKVELPKALPSRLTTLQKACTVARFNANPATCPAASIVGHAKAVTPLLPVPLQGPAYFVSNGSEAFPNLIMVLQGYGVTVDLVGSTFISKKGITSSTFKTVPDAPVGSFELTLPQGPYSALAAGTNFCKKKSLAMPTEFVAQNGAKIKTSTKIRVTSCPRHAREHRANKRGRKHHSSGKHHGGSK